MLETDIAYLAGIIDGEGCIYIKKRKDSKFIGYQVMVSITQKDGVFLNKLKNLINLRCYFREYNSTRNNAALLSYASNQAYQLCKLTLPYLILKKDQAEFLIYFYENLRSHRWKKNILLDSTREYVFQKIKLLKHKKG